MTEERIPFPPRGGDPGPDPWAGQVISMSIAVTAPRPVVDAMVALLAAHGSVETASAEDFGDDEWMLELYGERLDVGAIRQIVLWHVADALVSMGIGTQSDSLQVEWP